MLEDVRAFKELYYYAAWARYDLAKPGTLVVVPNSSLVREIALDYRSMRQMFLQEPPSFDSIVDRLRTFERQVNT